MTHVMSEKEVAEFLEPRINELLAKARADEARKDCEAMCQHCVGHTSERVPFDNTPREFAWVHHYEAQIGGKVLKQDVPCKADAIHERLHREAQERKEGRS